MAPKVAIVYVCVRMSAWYFWIVTLTGRSLVLDVRPHPEAGRGREEGY